jgi:tripartite-type tricarboxylate transporter receptor subunit TctC
VIADTVPGFECTTWVSLFAPTGTPRAIIDRLNAELGNAMRDPGIASRLSAVTYDATHKTPEELNQRVKEDYDRIGKVFRQLGVTLD